eukprot:m.274325 g.274325  ORF g.274325 m.274325 type:complete len:62 (-) comp17685_c0_seq5:3564-3749(-)
MSLECRSPAATAPSIINTCSVFQLGQQLPVGAQYTNPATVDALTQCHWDAKQLLEECQMTS